MRRITKTNEERETLCEVTKKPCEWQSEEWYDANGEMESWDLFCVDCGRWRDWSKEEAIDETSDCGQD